MDKEKELRKLHKFSAETIPLISYIYLIIIFYLVAAFTTPDNTPNTVKIFWSLFGVVTGGSIFTIRDAYRAMKKNKDFKQENTNDTPK